MEAQRNWIGNRKATLGLTALAATLAALPATAATPDHIEPGRQGESIPADGRVLPQPYSKGVDLVGHVELKVDYVMAWSGTCAYTPDKTGVNVIDVSNPAAPKVVGHLTEKGAVGAGETVHAAGGILAASVYGVSGPKAGGPGQEGKGDDGWLAVYDVSDCAHPKLITEFKWPERIHTVTVSADGKRIYGPVLSPFTGNGGIQVVDISDRAKPRYLGRFGITRPDGTTFEFAPHNLSLSADERRIYVGAIDSKGGDLNQVVKNSPPHTQSTSTNAGGIYILDNSDIVMGRPDPKLRLVGMVEHAGWHSVALARIGGVPHLVGAGELGSCPGAFPRISNIADERHPRIVGEFRLEMNTRAACPDPTKFEVAAPGSPTGTPGWPSSHWNDVDSATETRVGLFPFNAGGLRIADLRNPAKPVEVAYFKPGDACMTHARYVSATGHIWFACGTSGFYVLKLKPEVRTALGYPQLP
jgi:hypothetical protein